jgi:hypothetical protein
MQVLNTTSEVIEALGGIQAVRELTGRKYTAAHNWLRAKQFPSNTYRKMTSALQDKGLSAPPSLWGQQ